jgi:predicted ester cyclase
MSGLSPEARLLRGFATDFLSSHDLAAVTWVMDEAYRLDIGNHTLAGRDEVYLPATAAQLEQFPGLCVTVHDVLLGDEGIAMRFTEHGVSARHGGRAAAWGGITMFTVNGGRLREGWAEEDYFARKRQLATGICDRIAAPHPFPWDVAVAPPNPEARAAAERWLGNPDALARRVDIEQICAEAPHLENLLAVDELRIVKLISAGDRIAFRLIAAGSYAGGFDDIDQTKLGEPVTLGIAGLATVRAGAVSGVQIAFDRLGLHRSLSGTRKERTREG